MSKDSQADEYLLGHTPHETERLQRQALLYDPSTRALFLAAGLQPDMRVLELGTGAGDVAMLAAELVGPSGQVVSVDRDAGVLQTARQRAQARNLTQISFVASRLEELSVEGEFDAIVGRLVLIYVADPSALLRRLATQLRGPGIVAFQDVDWGIGPICSVRSKLLEQLFRWVPEMFRRAGLNDRTGLALREIFVNAGLPNPSMHIYTALGGGPEFAGYEYWASGLRTSLPALVRFGIATEDEVAIDTFADRLRNEIVSQNGTLALPAFIGAWARRGQSRAGP
jgi:SAM-dependent methyltransferase